MKNKIKLIEKCAHFHATINGYWLTAPSPQTNQKKMCELETMCGCGIHFQSEKKKLPNGKDK